MVGVLEYKKIALFYSVPTYEYPETSSSNDAQGLAKPGNGTALEPPSKLELDHFYYPEKDGHKKIK